MKKLLTPSDFEHLRAHLSALDPAIEGFCAQHGFAERTTGLGRYPRRRIARYGELNLYFDLQMDLDEGGEYFSKFHPKLPYSMSAGAWVDIALTRYSKSFQCFEKLPFSELQAVLLNHLVRGYSKIKDWSRDFVIKEGVISSISE